MFLQKRKEIADLAKQFRTEYKKEFGKPKSVPKMESGQTEAKKPDWFIKACGIGLFLLSIGIIDQHPVYAVIFIIIGIATCFAAHDTPSPED